MATQYRLTLEVRAPESTSEIELENFPATIGRSEDCAVVVEDPRISREHLSIELEEQGLVWTDKGSTNGFRLNGQRVGRGRLRRGDRVRVAGTVLQVVRLVEARQPKPRGEVDRDAPALRGARRRRNRTRALTVAATLLVIGSGVGYVALKSQRNEASTQTQQADTAALQSELQSLQEDFARAAAITPKLLSRLESLRQRSKGVDFGTPVHPIEEFAKRMEYRHRIETQSRLQQIVRKHEELLSSQQYGALLAYLEGERELLGAGSFHDNELFNNLWTQAREATDAAVRETRQHFEYLRDFADPGEIQAYLDRAAERLAGSEHEAPIRGLWKEFLGRGSNLVAAANSDNGTESESAAASEVAAPLELLSLVRAPIEAGELADRSLDLGNMNGKPVGFSDDLLDVETVRGREQVVWNEIPKDKRLRIAEIVVPDESAFAVAEVAYSWGHHGVGAKLLHAYLMSSRRDREVRQKQINEFLTQARRLDRVPVGGFDYDRKHGWESETERVERQQLAAMTEALAKLGPKTRVEQLRATVSEVSTQIQNEELSRGTRQSVRRQAVEALQAIRTELVASLEKSVGKRLDKLREAKIDLNQRRKAAIELIMDPVIYLPENHPDWPKGDHRNGQLEVDKVVNHVRDLWDQGKKLAFTPSKKLWQAYDRVALIDDELLGLLRYERVEAREPVLVDLTRNRHATVHLQNFALDDLEARLYRWSRRVEVYNQDLQDPDLPERDRAHVVVVNDYREMLGFQRMFIDIRLCRASTKHSGVCDAAGQIWHDGPDGTPQSRANAEGFTDGVGENVAIGYGNPKDIWVRGWYRASDHHRNAIGAGWNCIGYGYVGRVGTQMFATTKPPFDDVPTP